MNAVDGALVHYQSVWQRQNLVLVTVPSDDPTALSYMASIIASKPSLVSNDTALIVTTNQIAAVPSPGVLVADRWGEVYCIKGASRAADLPGADELVEWVRYVQNECPECQGEMR
jgi:hypothetical protein